MLESTLPFQPSRTSDTKFTFNFAFRFLKFRLFLEISIVRSLTRLMKKHTTFHVLALPAFGTLLVGEGTVFPFFVISTILFEFAERFRPIWSHHYKSLYYYDSNSVQIDKFI